MLLTVHRHRQRDNPDEADGDDNAAHLDLPRGVGRPFKTVQHPRGNHHLHGGHTQTDHRGIFMPQSTQLSKG